MQQKASFLAEKLTLLNAVIATFRGDPWGLIPRGLDWLGATYWRKAQSWLACPWGDLARRGRAHPRRSNNRQVAQIS